MAKAKAFDLSESREEFGRQCHNWRTIGAWECGVRRAVYGGDLCYRRSASDYATAERRGREYAAGRLKRGHRFKCGECGTLHGIKK